MFVVNKAEIVFVPTKFIVQAVTLVAQRVKRLPPMRETRVRSLGREDPLEKEMAPHSSTLAWRIPWMEEPGRLQSAGSQRVRHDWATSLQWWPVTMKTYYREPWGHNEKSWLCLRGKGRCSVVSHSLRPQLLLECWDHEGAMGEPQSVNPGFFPVLMFYKNHQDL